MRRLILLLLALSLTACPGPDPAPSDADGDALPGDRTYLMAGLAESYDILVPRRYVISLDKLTAPVPPMPDADATTGADATADAETDDGPKDLTEAIVLPLYHLGIPWDEFDQTPVSSLPGPWVNAVNDVKNMVAPLGKPIAIALSPANLSWDSLTEKASADGANLRLQDNWLLEYCYDPSNDPAPTRWQEAYVRYVEWMVDQFDPQFVFLARRINRYDEQCADASPNAYAAVAAYATAAHNALQARANPPTTVVTVDVEDLYGYVAGDKKPGRCVVESAAQCFDQRKTLLDVFTADRLGLESYPANAIPGEQSIPGDWLTRVANYRTDMKPLIAGTGLAAERMEVQELVCTPLLETSEQLQLSWLDQVFGAAAAFQMELVVWSSPVDLLPHQAVRGCSCVGDFATCEHLGDVNVETRLGLINGLYDIDGNARQAGTVWVNQLQ